MLKNYKVFNKKQAGVKHYLVTKTPMRNYDVPLDGRLSQLSMVSHLKKMTPKSNLESKIISRRISPAFNSPKITVWPTNEDKNSGAGTLNANNT